MKRVLPAHGSRNETNDALPALPWLDHATRCATDAVSAAATDSGICRNQLPARQLLSTPRRENTPGCPGAVAFMWLWWDYAARCAGCFVAVPRRAARRRADHTAAAKPSSPKASGWASRS